ncbi:MAG: hypothetical protein Q7R92_01920 [bacterium]|nr:hypothetical protein [bacterium]
MAVKLENLPGAVANQDWRLFTVETDGLYVITITARCKNWRQNLFKLRFGDDDLAVQIDDFQPYAVGFTDKDMIMANYPATCRNS